MRTALHLGIVFVGLGAVILWLAREDVPEREKLTEVAGRLGSLEAVSSRGSSLSAVRFTLAGDRRNFSYGSSAGEIKEVWSVLERGRGAELRILADLSTAHAPLWDERVFHAAFEVSLGGKPVRRYDDVRKALENNAWLGGVLGWLFILGGAAGIVAGLRNRA